MAVCYYCGCEMLTSDGCLIKKIKYRPNKSSDYKIYERIKTGSPEDLWPDMPDNRRCRDCGAKKGFPHHPNCDVERCPICKGQAISCDCCDGEMFLIIPSQ